MNFGNRAELIEQRKRLMALQAGNERKVEASGG